MQAQNEKVCYSPNRERFLKLKKICTHIFPCSRNLTVNRTPQAIARRATLIAIASFTYKTAFSVHEFSSKKTSCQKQTKFQISCQFGLKVSLLFNFHKKILSPKIYKKNN